MEATGVVTVENARKLLAWTIAAAVVLIAPAPVARAGHSEIDHASTGPSGGNGPFDVLPFSLASGDLRHVFFRTREQLVPEDADAGRCSSPPQPCIDAYERFGGVTRLLSPGEEGPSDAAVGVIDSSFDGSKVLLETNRRLTPEDTDSGFDQYVRSGGVTRLASTGPHNDNGPHDVFLGFFSEDASRVFFGSQEQLVPEDTDANRDLYERVGDTTRLISTGPITVGRPGELGFVGASADGTSVLFFTQEALVPEDDDDGRCFDEVYSVMRGCRDIYVRSNGVTKLVSTGPTAGHPFADVTQDGALSDDGSRAMISTYERLVPADTDESRDLYLRAGDQTTLVTQGATSSSGAFDAFAFRLYEAFVHPYHRRIGLNRGGDRITFFTRESLVAQDTDTLSDIYQWRNGSLTFIDADLRDAQQAADDSATLYWSSLSPLVAEDTDVESDVYTWTNGETRLLTPAPADPSKRCNESTADPWRPGLISCPRFMVAAPDASRVFFSNGEPMLPGEDSGGVYESSGGHIERMIPALPSLSGVQITGINRDGSRVSFDTFASLTGTDTDTRSDTYTATRQQPPACSSAHPLPDSIESSNHKFVEVSLRGVSDPDGDAVTMEIVRVTQDEAVSSKGDTTSPDARITSRGLRVRAERSPHGDGRVYTVAFTASDGRGGTCSGSVHVDVPRQKSRPAVDSAPPAYDSFARGSRVP